MSTKTNIGSRHGIAGSAKPPIVIVNDGAVSDHHRIAAILRY